MKARIASIENLIATDPGERNVFGLVVADQLRLAAQSLRLAKRVGIMSGFFVGTAPAHQRAPHEAVHSDAPCEGAGETDGPPGAKAVGSALEQLGIEVDYLTDRWNAGLFRVLGLDPVVDVSHYLDDARPTHLLAVERIGRGADGRYRNMRGVDVTDTTAPLDELFIEGSRRGLTTIGIGDGGNEIGMGKVFVDVLDTADRTGPNVETGVGTVVATDFCIAAGVSNWGAYGLAGALSVLAGRDLLPSAEEAIRHVEVLVREGGAVDGVTHRKEPTVDGIELSHSIRILENIRLLVAPSPLESARGRVAWPSAAPPCSLQSSDSSATDRKVGSTHRLETGATQASPTQAGAAQPGATPPGAGLLVGVLGYGETGRAAVALLRSRGHRVRLSERDTVTVDRGTVLAGVETGGHTIDFLCECDLVVASPGVRADAEIRNALHLRGIPVMSELELGYQLLVGTGDPACTGDPAWDRDLIAVTGTIGKRTTVELLQQLFDLSGRPLMIGGNRGRPLSALILDADPRVREGIHAPANGVRESRRAGIAPASPSGEKSVPPLAVAVSSFQLETVVHFRPHVAIMLNIDEAHLDRHRTVAEYVRIKSRIFMNQRPDDVLILTFDDLRLRPLARKHQGRTFFVSGRQEVDRGAWLLDGMVYANIRGTVEQIGPARTPFPENLLASLVTARVCGITTEQIAAALPKLAEQRHSR